MTFQECLEHLFLLGLAFGLVGTVYAWLAKPAKVVNPFNAVGEKFTLRWVTESLKRLR
ncbi:MAG: hypothetical protein SFU86_04310 [Pirellulaceae bacterium]|nr:hypothetical protein [Pirellulaceae bacterium]